AFAVCFLNRNGAAKTIEFSWKDKYIKDDSFQRQLDAAKTNYNIRDLWNKKDLGTTGSVLKAVVPAHDVLMLRLTKAG
ncbi:MAG: glycoside hydrolase family 27 protein, partial [Acidobacteriota bacterium]